MASASRSRVGLRVLRRRIVPRKEEERKSVYIQECGGAPGACLPERWLGPPSLRVTALLNLWS